MNPALFTRMARADLADVLAFADAQWNREQAENYLRALHRVTALLASDPAMGQAIDRIRPGYRKYPVGLHMIYYRDDDGEIEVVRILPRNMDVE